jgi:hypothetical protein
MSVHELKAAARKHWTKWLPDKVADLRKEGRLNEALHSAAVAAQEEIESLMKAGYSVDEAREVALPQHILLPPEDPDSDLSPELKQELAEKEEYYRTRVAPYLTLDGEQDEDWREAGSMSPSLKPPNLTVVMAGKIDGGAYRIVGDGVDAWVEEWKAGGWVKGGASIGEVLDAPPVSSELASRLGIPPADLPPAEQGQTLEMPNRPGIFTDTLATWEQYLARLEKLPDNVMNKDLLIEHAQMVIGEKRRLRS